MTKIERARLIAGRSTPHRLNRHVRKAEQAGLYSSLEAIQWRGKIQRKFKRAA